MGTIGNVVRDIIIRQVQKKDEVVKNVVLNVIPQMLQPTRGFTLKAADYVYVVSKGAVVFEGNPGQLQGNKEMEREYLAV